MNSNAFRQLIIDEKIVVIIRGMPREHIGKAVDALVASKIHCIEVTANTPGFVEMIKDIKREFSESVIVGAGTVLTSEIASQAIEGGAEYIVAPDVNPEVMGFCRKKEIAVVPGAATPTEILMAHRLGAAMVKLFPAGTLGVEYVRQVRGPIDKDVGLLAVGGIHRDNIADFMRAGCQGVGIGSSLVKKSLVANQQWDELTALASECKAQINSAA